MVQERIQGHDEQASRKAQVLLKWKYTLKRKVWAAHREICPKRSALWTFVFLGMGCPKAIQLASGLDLFLMPPGGDKVAQGHLSCLLALAYFLGWSLLTLEMETGRRLSKGQGRYSRATGRGLSKGRRKSSRAISWR